MVTAVILAGGAGVRMQSHGLPKQFLTLYGKPIIGYTLDVFEQCDLIDQIVIPCNIDWIDHMSGIVKKYHFTKVKRVIAGGSDRQGSILRAIEVIADPAPEDIVLIHDGVRPLVERDTILENIRTAREKGNAMTVRQNTETVVVTRTEGAMMDDFKDRDITYTLTSPQTFRVKELQEVYRRAGQMREGGLPMPDASLLYAYLGKEVYLVKETGMNLKITTPEDFYYLRAYLELQENKEILGV